LNYSGFVILFCNKKTRMQALPALIHILTSVLAQGNLQYCIWTRLFTDMQVFHFQSYRIVDLFK